MSQWVCPHGVWHSHHDTSHRCETCAAAQRAILDSIIQKPKPTLVELLEKQLRSDVEIGMSFEKGSNGDYYWQGVVSGTRKAIEIAREWVNG